MELALIAARLPRAAPQHCLSVTPGGQSEGALNDLRTLRAALILLVEDPPFALGRSTLARRVLPHERDTLQRGWALADMLHLAVASLRPQHTIPLQDRRWWPYQICVGEFIEGRSRGEMQLQLAISASTYSRAKHRGLEQISATLPYLAAAAQHQHQSPARIRDAI